MGSKRSKLEVVKDILTSIRNRDGRIKRTHILYKANLSHRMLDEYLNDLISRGFVEELEQKKGKRYRLTQRGHEYLNKFNMVSGFMDLFGFD
ncbi:MAG: winged helix-turn-helix domain-containing protein [Nanobdellota archaeon]